GPCTATHSAPAGHPPTDRRAATARPRRRHSTRPEDVTARPRPPAQAAGRLRRPSGRRAGTDADHRAELTLVQQSRPSSSTRGGSTLAPGITDERVSADE